MQVSSLDKTESETTSVQVALDPAPDDPLRLPPVVQFHLRADTGQPLPEALVVRGEISKKDLQAWASGEPSPSLLRRTVTAWSWTGAEGDLVVAPTEAFEAGETVSVALPAIGWTRAWAVEADDLPRWEQVWPADGSGWAAWAVWCASSASTGWAEAAEQERWLGVGPTRGLLGQGMLPSFGEDCVRWTPQGELLGNVVMPPPLVDLGQGRRVRIAPKPIETATKASPPTRPPACAEGMVEAGPTCAKILDDRVLLFGNSNPALVGIEIAGKRYSGIPTQQVPIVVKGLAPESLQEGRMVFVDAWGQQYEGAVSWRMAVREPHVVINEVMANPAGKEPDQEWVELYNDGQDSVDLGMWQFEDLGLAAVLPSFVLEPGAYVLVVHDTFDAASWADRPPAAGTPLLRVPHLGKSGLSNSGEPLRLVRADGVVASTVPALASPHASASVSRIVPDASDTPGSFMFCTDGGTPGESNDACIR